MKSLNFNIITEFHKSQHEETFLTAINKLDNKAERSTASRFCKTTDRSIVTFGTNNLISNKNVASVQKRRRLYLNIKTIIKIWETVSTWQSQFQRKKNQVELFQFISRRKYIPSKKKNCSLNITRVINCTTIEHSRIIYTTTNDTILFFFTKYLFRHRGIRTNGTWTFAYHVQLWTSPVWISRGNASDARWFT